MQFLKGYLTRNIIELVPTFCYTLYSVFREKAALCADEMGGTYETDSQDM